MRLIAGLCMTILFLSSELNAQETSAKQERWAVYYTDKLPASAFESLDTLAFDSDYHPALEPLKAQGKTLLGYISLGEAEKYRSYFKEIKTQNLLLKGSTLWKGHYIIDVRKAAWQDMVLDKLIPPILAKGFDGIMIDTIDSAVDREINDPKKYAGMKKSAIQLIKAIRARYPDIKIMMNRGLEILPDVAGDLDMFMAESIYTDWVPNPKKPVLVKEQDYQEYLRIINNARTIAPNLKVYSLDYWQMNDIKGVRHIYAKQREQGFVPYVSTMDLQHFHPEPQ